MIKHRIEELAPDREYSRRAGCKDTTVRWAVSRRSTGSTQGSVAWIEVKPGGRYPVERYPDCERIVYVAEGSGKHLGADGPQRLGRGDGVLVPKGGWHGFENDGAEPTLLVALFGPYADISEAVIEPYTDGAPSGPDVVRVSTSEIEWDPDLRDDMGFVGLDAKWIFTSETAGAEHLLFGVSRFAANGSHVLHRHPNAEEAIYVVDGVGHHLIAGKPDVPIRAGDLTYAGAGEWHGHLASLDGEMNFLFLYLGGSSLEGAGYEIHAETVGAGE